MTLGRPLAALQELRGTRNIALAATHLDVDMLVYLDVILRSLPPDSRLDVVLACRGGEPIAARGLARLCRRYAAELTFIVPDRCESTGTVLVLAANTIIAGPAAVFSPVDPVLQGEGGDQGGPAGIAAEDVRLLGQMTQDWFGVAGDSAGRQALEMLGQHMFPTSLTAFYRSFRLVETICGELLNAAGVVKPALRKAVIERLLHGYHAHNFPLDRDDLRDLGLPVLDLPDADAILTDIAVELRQLLNVRAPAPDGSWCDAAIIGDERQFRRIRSASPPSTIWHGGSW